MPAKNLFLAVSCVLTLFALNSPFSLATYGSTSQTSAAALAHEQNCTPQIRALVATITIPEQLAISLAETSSEFISLKGSNSTTFLAINTLTYNTPSCVVTFEGIQVVFAIRDSSGIGLGQLVVDENSQFSSVTSVQFVRLATSFSFTPIGDAWEFYANSAGTALVLYSSMQFNQPAPTVPSGYTCGHYCAFALWTGLTNNALGSSGNLAQAGDEAQIACTSPSNCSTNYYGWWENYPASPTTCTPAGGIASGNNLSFEVENEALYGGSSSKWDFYVYNNTTGHTCSKVGFSWTSFTNPHYSQTAIECDNGGTGSCSSSSHALAQFSNTGMALSADTYYGGGIQSIPGPYSHHDDPMNACSYSNTNIASSGSIGSGGTFSFTYHNSACT